MANLNKVMLIGNLTRDVELRYTASNTAVANIGLAVNRRWKDQSGQQQEETTFVDCTAWGRTAEVANEYLRKGNPVYLEGRLTLDQWEDQQGNNRSKLKVTVEAMQFLHSRDQGQQQTQSQQQRTGGYQGPHTPSQPQGGYQTQGPPIDDSDVPF